MTVASFWVVELFGEMEGMPARCVVAGIKRHKYLGA